MDSSELKFNPLDEDELEKDQQLVAQTSNSSDSKSDHQIKQKPKSTGSVLKLFKDMWHYIWDENDKGEKIKHDISKIESERNKKKLLIAKKQQRLEAKARKKAQAKAKKVQARLLKERAVQEKKQKLERVADKQNLKSLSLADKYADKYSDKTQQLDKDKSLQQLAQDKFEQTKPGTNGLLHHKDLVGSSSALGAGLLKKKASPIADKFGFQADLQVKKTKKQSWLSKLFSSQSKQTKTMKLSEPDQQSESIAMIQPSVKVKPVKQDKNDQITLKIKGSQKQSWLSKLFNSKNKSTKTKPAELKSDQLLAKKTLRQETSEVKKQSVKNDQPLTPVPTEMVETSDFAKHKEKMSKRLAAEREKYANLKIREDIENRFWHSHNIVRANLIKEQETLFFNWHSKILTLILAMGLACLTIGILYGALLVWESNKLNENQDIFDNLASVNEEINKVEVVANEILGFNDKLVLVDFILDNHIYWTNFFSFLEEYTIVNVYYEGFSGDIGGQYSLPSVARDFRDVYLQIKLMQQYEQVMSADTESAKQLQQQIVYEVIEGQETPESTTEEKIKFILDLILNRKIFLR